MLLYVWMCLCVLWENYVSYASLMVLKISCLVTNCKFLKLYNGYESKSLKKYIDLRCVKLEYLVSQIYTYYNNYLYSAIQTCLCFVLIIKTDPSTL